MEPLRDDQLIADLQALRPTPRPQFAAELDERTAAGFPRRSRLQLPSPPAMRLLIPAGGVAAILLAIAVALSAGDGSGSSAPSQHLSEVPDHAVPGPGGASHAKPDSAAAAGEAQEREPGSSTRGQSGVAHVRRGAQDAQVP